MSSGEVASLYHRETVHVGGLRRRRTATRRPDAATAAPRTVTDFVRMDPANRPEPFKRYPALEPQRLPDRLPPGGTRAVDVLSGRAVSTAAPVDPSLLARLLFYSAGVTRVAGRRGARTYFRAAPSAGNLHPLETYVVSGPIEGQDTGSDASLAAGVYHFAPDAFGLERLRDGDHRPALADATAAPAVANGPATLVLTGIPWRTAWKYAERGWRHLYWDAGAMVANLLAVADAYGVETQVLLGFHDPAVCELLGIDGVSEMPLAVVRVGMPTSPAAPARVPSEVGGPPPTATRLAPAPVEFPLVTEAQRAGELRDTEKVERWRSARPSDNRPAAAPHEPPGSAHAEPIEEVILRRGSTRTMRHGTAPADLLEWAMASAAQYAPLDVLDAGPPGSTLLTHEMSVHAVDGTQPGLYGWQAGELRPHQVGDTAEAARARATRLCLDQPLGGDSAYTLFACCRLDRVLDAHGDRGYRAAQLEAGVVAGRLQLAAFALGYGGTGLTFYDDEVSDAFDTDAACMLVTSVGVPAYRAKRGGEPGHPTELTGSGPRPIRFLRGTGRTAR